MRTGLCLFLYLSLSLPLSRSLSSRDRLENSSPREHTMHTTRINSKKYSERNSRGGIILEEAIRGKSGEDEKLADAFVEFDSK